MKKIELKIEGMTCNHCVMQVTKAIKTIDGVRVVDVQIGKAILEYDDNLVAINRIIEAIEEEGYKVNL